MKYAYNKFENPSLLHCCAGTFSFCSERKICVLFQSSKFILFYSVPIPDLKYLVFLFQNVLFRNFLEHYKKLQCKCLKSQIKSRSICEIHTGIHSYTFMYTVLNFIPFSDRDQH